MKRKRLPTCSALVLVIGLTFTSLILNFDVKATDGLLHDTLNSDESDDTLISFSEVTTIIDSVEDVLDYCFIRRANDFGKSTEGADIYGYYLRDTIVKLHVIYYSERSSTVIEMYFNHGRLLTVVSKIREYNQSITDTGALEITNIEYEYSYFLTPESVISFDVNGLLMDKDDETLTSEAQFYRAIAVEYDAKMSE